MIQYNTLFFYGITPIIVKYKKLYIKIYCFFDVFFSKKMYFMFVRRLKYVVYILASKIIVKLL